MTNNDLRCNKCGTQHHPMDYCTGATMTNETANKIAVEIATDYSIDIVDIRGILRSKIDDLDITLIDMKQYVKRSKVEEVCKWADNECNHMIAITVIDRIRERLLNEGGNDEEDTR